MSSPSPSPPSSTVRRGGGGKRGDAASHPGFAKASEWDRHRGRITELYRDQGLHLDEVIAVMAKEHAFHANPRMYKTRIKKWGLDKNVEAREVAYMIRLRCEREAQGKDSEFIVRGHKFGWAKVEKYLRRDPILVKRLEANDGLPEIGDATGIICRTPSPDPARFYSVPSAPLMAAEQRLPEELARLTRDYFAAALETGIWLKVGQGSYTSRTGPETSDALRYWGQNMRQARHLIGVGEVVDGFRQLGTCLDQMRQFVRDQDPSLLFHLLGNTLGMTPISQDIGACISRHIRELTRITLGETHPLSRIFDLILALVKTDSHFRSAPIPMKCLIDLFDPGGTELNPFTAELHARFTRLLHRSLVAEPGDADDGGPSLSEMIQYFEASKDIHTIMRFYFTYLSYMSDTVIKQSQDGVTQGAAPAGAQITSCLALRGKTSPSPPSLGSGATSPERGVVRFREATSFYMFNLEVLEVTGKRGSAGSQVLFEVDHAGDQIPVVDELKGLDDMDGAVGWAPKSSSVESLETDCGTQGTPIKTEASYM